MKNIFKSAANRLAEFESVGDILNCAEPNPSASPEFNDKILFAKELPKQDPKFAKLLEKYNKVSNSNVLDDFLATPTFGSRARTFARVSQEVVLQYRIASRFFEKYEQAKGNDPVVYKNNM
jgi:hypothetical protein